MTNLPAPKDPLTTAIETGTESAIHELGETARHYADMLMSPGLTAGGGLISDTVNFWRFKNQIRILLKTKAFLEKMGLQPKHVAPRILEGVLDKGSLETEPTIQDRWARLLITAADSASPDVMPAFVDILSGLTTREAGVLQLVYDERRDQQPLYAGVRISFAFYKLGIKDDERELMMNNFERLQIAEAPNAIIQVGELKRALEKAARPYSSPFEEIESKPSHRGQHELTYLGAAFLNACMGPVE